MQQVNSFFSMCSELIGNMCNRIDVDIHNYFTDIVAKTVKESEISGDEKKEFLHFISSTMQDCQKIVKGHHDGMQQSLKRNLTKHVDEKQNELKRAETQQNA